MKVEILNMEQRSYEWFQARLGIPTASSFADITAKGRGSAPSARRVAYQHKLLAERLSRELDEGFAGGDLMRGIELEEAALAAYQFETDAKVQKIGLLHAGFCAASPDGMVGNSGLVEVKAPRRWHYVRMALSENPAADYLPQIYGQLWLADRPWCDLVLYSPPLPIFIHRVYRDDERIAELANAVEEFAVELDSMEIGLRKQLGMGN